MNGARGPCLPKAVTNALPAILQDRLRDPVSSTGVRPSGLSTAPSRTRPFPSRGTREPFPGGWEVSDASSKSDGFLNLGVAVPNPSRVGRSSHPERNANISRPGQVAFMGKTGQWVRWGRGDCEGWSLQIGNAYRGSVALQHEGSGKPRMWRASINACDLGVYPDCDTAMNRVEELIESEMCSVLQAWELYTAWKKARGTALT